MKKQIKGNVQSTSYDVRFNIIHYPLSIKHFLLGVVFSLYSILNTQYCFSQNIAINTTGAAANATAILDVSATNLGLLIPRMTLCQRTTPSCAGGLLDAAGDFLSGVAAQGLLVYQTDGTQGFYYNTSITITPTWAYLSSGGGSGWLLLGNAGTVDGTNFLGTTDAAPHPLNFRVENEKAGRIASSGETFLGYQAGNVNTGGGNAGFGYGVLRSNIGGGNNTATGFYALRDNTAGDWNTACGNAALQSNTTGGQNVAIGAGALFTQSYNPGAAWFSNNVAVGYYALFSNQPTLTTNGINNTAIGVQALQSNITGSNNTAVGYQAGVLSNALTNASAIGYNAKVGASSSLVLGGTGTDAVDVGIGITTPAALLHLYKNTSATILMESEANLANISSIVQMRAYSDVSAGEGGTIQGLAIMGTKSAPSPTQGGSDLLRLWGGGYGSSIVQASSMINFTSTALWTGTSRPSEIKIYTTDVTGNPLERMRIKENGYVGIGPNNLNTAAALLHVMTNAGGDQEVFRLQNTKTGGPGAIGDAVRLDFYLGNGSNPSGAELAAKIQSLTISPATGSYSGALTFHTTNAGTSAERMRIDNAGNVGIGITSSLTRLLEVNGTARIGASGTTITNIITATVSLNLASIVAGASLAQTFTVTNAATASSVFVSPQTALTDGLIICYCRVSAVNTVEVKFKNTSAAPIDMALMNWYFTVIQ